MTREQTETVLSHGESIQTMYSRQNLLNYQSSRMRRCKISRNDGHGAVEALSLPMKSLKINFDNLIQYKITFVIDA